MITNTERWRIEMLGCLRASRGDEIVQRFRTRKTASLFAFLACGLGRSHPRDELIELFWPQSDLDAGRASLSQALASLRRQLEPPGVARGSVLVADMTSVRLDPRACETDVGLFEEALRKARRLEGAGRASHLEEALALYRGEFLPGDDHPWALSERARLREMHLAAVLELVDRYLRDGEPSLAQEWARRGLSLDPERGELKGALARARLAAEHAAPVVEARPARFVPSPGSVNIAAMAPGRGPLSLATAAVVISRADESGVDPERAYPPNDAPALGEQVREDVAFPAGGDASRAVVTRPHEDAGLFCVLVVGREPSAPLDLQPLVGQLVARHHGRILPGGPGHAAGGFRRPLDAALCALDLAAHWAERGWAGGACMALDIAEAEPGGELTGMTRSAARLLGAARGGHILCSAPIALLLGRRLDLRLLDLGTYRLVGAGPAERLFHLVAPGAPEHVPEPRAERAQAGRLPLILTRFFGRQEESERVAGWLADPATRLVTIAGPPGVGKTRLAIEVALSQHRQRGPVWFVSLAEVKEPHLFFPAVSDAVGGTATSVDPLDAILDALGESPALLVLDGFDHLARAAVGLLRQLLAAAPRLVCLVTSRFFPVGPGERVLHLSPLPLPAGELDPASLAHVPSVQLFVDRAQAVRPDFQLTARTGETVAAVCRALGGIPLALELAAARVSVLGLQDLLQRLQGAGAGAGLGAARNQRTLRAVIDASFRLLSPGLRSLIARLSVFQGGWTREAMEEVCGGSEAVEALNSLIHASLVVPEEGGPEQRFSMLAAIREQAAGNLPGADRPALAQRHAEYFLAFAERAARGMEGPGQLQWMDRLSAERDNLRAALQWAAMKRRAEVGLRLCSALTHFWVEQGHLEEGRRWFERFFPARRAPPLVRAVAFRSAGRLAYRYGDLGTARTLIDRSLSIQRNQPEDGTLRASCLNLLGLIAWHEGDHERATALFEDLIAWERTRGDEARAASALGNLANVLAERGLMERSEEFRAEAVAILRRLGDEPRLAVQLYNQGEAALKRGDATRAEALLRESQQMAERTGSAPLVAKCKNGLGDAALALGRLNEARQLQRESLASLLRLGERLELAPGLESFARLAHAEGAHRHAATLLAAAATLRKRRRTPLPPFRREAHARLMESLREKLGPTAFEHAWNAGLDLDAHKAIELALG